MTNAKENPVIFPCPVCKVPLSFTYGHSIHPNDPKFGVTLWCASKRCPASEVVGHGDDDKRAYEVIKHKFSWFLKQKP